MILATSTPQKLGMVFAVLLVIGWLVFILAHLKRSGVKPGQERELAPNRKAPPDDDELEGPKLEQHLTFAMILLVIVGIGLPLYWLNEPRREEGAIKSFDRQMIQVGFQLFQPATSTIKADAKFNELHFSCAGCHGSNGQGGATSYAITTPSGGTQLVTWQAPPLNTVLLRFTPDTVRFILIYGRSNTPMPAWGLAGGGPMNDQQIDALVAYLQSIQLSPAQAKAQAAQYGDSGQALFNAYCARCHTKGFSYGQPQLAGGGGYGPNLTNGGELRQFPSPTDQIDFITKGADYGKAYGARGIGGMAPAVRLDPQTAGVAMQGGGMPYFSNMLAPDQIQAVVNYERGL